MAAAGRLAGWKELAAIPAGVLMLVWAAAYFRGRSLLLPAGFRFGFPLGFGTGRRRAGRRVAVPGALRIAMPASLRAAGLGALLGFMPCGLLATMEIKAAGTGGVGSGLLVMLAFGLGTVPGLTAWGVAAAATGPGGEGAGAGGPGLGPAP